MLPCLWLSVSVCTSCKKWNFAVAKSEMLYMEKTLKLAFMYHKPLSVPFYGKTKLHNGRHLYNIFILNWRQKSRIFCGTSWVGSERRCGFGWMFFFYFHVPQGGQLCLFLTFWSVWVGWTTFHVMTFLSA